MMGGTWGAGYEKVDLDLARAIKQERYGSAPPPLFYVLVILYRLKLLGISYLAGRHRNHHLFVVRNSYVSSKC